jgi:hypothetical protein
MAESISHLPGPHFVPCALRWLATGTLAIGQLASTSCAETARMVLPVSPELAAQLQRLEQDRQRLAALQGTIQRDIERVERQLSQPAERPTPTVQTPLFNPGGRRNGR